MSKALKELSQYAWTVDLANGSGPTLDQINCGSLQRIADATEVMAKNYVSMQSDLEYYKDRYARQQAEIQRLKNSRAGYMAALTKLRRKHNAS